MYVIVSQLDISRLEEAYVRRPLLNIIFKCQFTSLQEQCFLKAVFYAGFYLTGTQNEMRDWRTARTLEVIY